MKHGLLFFFNAADEIEADRRRRAEAWAELHRRREAPPLPERQALARTRAARLSRLVPGLRGRSAGV